MPEPDYPRPIVTVDVALFTIGDGSREGRRGGGEGVRRVVRRAVRKAAPPDTGAMAGAGLGTGLGAALEVALVRRRAAPMAGAFALPGTYLRLDEDADLEAAAVRVLREKCGLSGLYVEQLRTYSGATRDPRGWSATTAFTALVPRPTFDAACADMRLIPATQAASLPFDHARIVADGIERLRGKATYTTLPAKLLPELFTLRELEEVYEAVLGRAVQTANFRRKFADLKAYGAHAGRPFLEQTTEFRGGRHRPAALYRAATSELVTFPQRF